MIAYKVVRLTDRTNVFKSIIHPTLGPDYIVGQVVKPVIKGAPLMAFRNLREALWFLWNCGALQDYTTVSQRAILKVQVRKSRQKVVPFCSHSASTYAVQDYLKKFQLERNKDLHKHDCSHANASTVFCSSITPLKVITSGRANRAFYRDMHKEGLV